MSYREHELQKGSTLTSVQLQMIDVYTESLASCEDGEAFIADKKCTEACSLYGVYTWKCLNES